MDIFNVDILKIHSVKHRKRTVEVDADIQYAYAAPERKTFYMLETHWEGAKRRMKFLETLEIRHPDYYENMSDEEYNRGLYGAKISDFSNLEIVDEFNRRLQKGLIKADMNITVTPLTEKAEG